MPPRKDSQSPYNNKENKSWTAIFYEWSLVVAQLTWAPRSSLFLLPPSSCVLSSCVVTMLSIPFDSGSHFGLLRHDISLVELLCLTLFYFCYFVGVQEMKENNVVDDWWKISNLH
jgi:hypothetical protein